MRILEQCTANAGPEVQVQINALRDAFSEDTSKPFELRASLGVQSPASSENYSPTPPAMQQSQQATPIQGTPPWSQLGDTASSKTMSPASEFSQPFDRMQAHPAMPYKGASFAVPSPTAYAPSNVQRTTSAPRQQGYGLQPVISNEQQPQPVWDPSGIFQQWNTAFGAQAQAQAQAVPQPAPIPDPRIQPTAAPMVTQQQSPVGQHPMYGSQQMPSTVSPVGPDPIPAMPTVTPVMWQDAFTNAYVSGHGHKRHRDESWDGQYPKRRT